MKELKTSFLMPSIFKTLKGKQYVSVKGGYIKQFCKDYSREGVYVIYKPKCLKLCIINYFRSSIFSFIFEVALSKTY